MAKAKTTKDVPLETLPPFALPERAEGESDQDYAVRVSTALVERHGAEAFALDKEGKVKVTVKRGRSVSHDGEKFLAGKSFRCTPEERDRLLSIGAIEGGKNEAPRGIGPAYNRDDEIRNRQAASGQVAV